MIRRRRHVLTAGLLAAVALTGVAKAEERVLLVIVHKERPENDISMNALARIYRGETKFWANNARILLFLPPASAEEGLRRSFLQSLLKLDMRDFQHLWQERLFRGENSQAPLTLSDDRAVAQAVFSARSGVGVIEADKVVNLEAVVKVVTVDGKAPVDAGYPLKW